ncbi:MAG: hypothetical protein ABIQ93_10260 [Saprospiraceae bacterium]
MISSFVFWAAMGYCGNEPRIPHLPGVPPPPDPFRWLRVAFAVLGGMAGGYLGYSFLEPSLAVSGLAAMAVGRISNGLSWVMLNPQPLPPKAVIG